MSKEKKPKVPQWSSFSCESCQDGGVVSNEHEVSCWSCDGDDAHCDECQGGGVVISGGESACPDC